MSEELRTNGTETKEPFVEELKVQAQDLFKTLSDLIREGTAARVTVTRGERTWIDIPLAIGVASGALMALYMPTIAAITGVAALLGGFTVRVERPQPPTSA